MLKRFIAVMVVCVATVLSLLAPAASADPRHENHHGRFLIICFVDHNRDGFGSDTFGNNEFDNNNGFGNDEFGNNNGFGNDEFGNDNGFGNDRFVRVFHRSDLVCFVIRRHHRFDGGDF